MSVEARATPGEAGAGTEPVALPAPEIPSCAEDVTPEWLTAVLRSGGFISHARVVSLTRETLGEGEGFVGQVVRIRLTLDRD